MFAGLNGSGAFTTFEAVAKPSPSFLPLFSFISFSVLMASSATSADCLDAVTEASMAEASMAS